MTGSLPPAAAQAVLADVLPGFRVIEVVTRAGGEVNAVYEVRGAGDVRPVVIKVYRQRGRTRPWLSKLAKEVYVYRLLARRGVEAIPRILRDESAGVPDLPAPFAVMTLLGGQPLATVGDRLTDRDTDRVYEHLGRLLAEVHSVPAATWGYVTTGIIDAQPSNTAYMLGQFGTKLRRFGDLGGDPLLAEAIARHVARHAELLAACPRPALCHNDFHDGNVLVARAGAEWRVTGYVDVENAIVADPLLDLAKTDYYALRHDPAKRRAFLRGYGPLPADWAERVALYQVHHALEFWNWSAATGKRELLADIRADIERLIDGHPAPGAPARP
jgi:aminoglycoside phosphotransferase (APT) family kinase protein